MKFDLPTVITIAIVGAIAAYIIYLCWIDDCPQNWKKK
jgi:hypothetical protein